MVLTVDTAGCVNWLQPLSAMVQEALENTVLDNHADKRVLAEVQVSKKKVPAHCWRKKKMSLDALKKTGGKVSLYPCHASPRVAQLTVPNETC